MSEEVTILEPKGCDFCQQAGEGFVQAQFDFKTVMGPWANGCTRHYEKFRLYDRLGTGMGQRLIVKGQS